jgi:hypothetical protein
MISSQMEAKAVLMIDLDFKIIEMFVIHTVCPVTH